MLSHFCSRIGFGTWLQLLVSVFLVECIGQFETLDITCVARFLYYFTLKINWFFDLFDWIECEARCKHSRRWSSVRFLGFTR